MPGGPSPRHCPSGTVQDKRAATTPGPQPGLLPLGKQAVGSWALPSPLAELRVCLGGWVLGW